MNSKTRSLIQEIKRRVKSPITGTNAFANENAVLDLAVQRLYDQLKKERLI